MSKFEDIVPPFELCKQIPAWAFADSVLMWCRADEICDDGGVEITARSALDCCDGVYDEVFPAPALAEIWNELPTVWNNRFLVMLDVTNRGKGHQIGYARLIDGVLDSDGDFCTQDLNPAIAALWLWFRVKGASC